MVIEAYVFGTRRFGLGIKKLLVSQNSLLSLKRSILAQFKIFLPKKSPFKPKEHARRSWRAPFCMYVIRLFGIFSV